MTPPEGSDESQGIRQEGGANVGVAGDLTVAGLHLNFFTRLGVGWLPLGASLSLIVYAVLVWPGGPNRQYVLFALFTVVAVGLAAVCCVLVGLRRQVVVAVLSLLCCVGALASLQYVSRTGEVPAKVHVGGPQPLVGEDPEPLSLEVKPRDPGAERDRLRLKLSVVDDDSATGTCVPRTGFTVTVRSSGVTPRDHRTNKASDTVEFDLGNSTETVELDFTLNGEKHCSMRLGEVGGTFHD